MPGVLPGAVLKQNWPDPQGQDDRAEVVRWLLLGEISLPVPSKLPGFPPGLFSHAGLGAEIIVLLRLFLTCLRRIELSERKGLIYHHPYRRKPPGTILYHRNFEKVLA